jgi:predicted ATPase
LAEALAAVRKTGECWYEAELYRPQGQLTLQQWLATSRQWPTRSPLAQAEECFWKAIDMAGEQQTTSLELRAAMGLSRLWHQQGRRNEARQLLAPIYSWFTERFDTADSQEAKALLAELA